jgi:hypothetical protein
VSDCRAFCFKIGIMDKDFVSLILLGLVSFGYLLYIHNGWLWDEASTPQPYNTKLFDVKIYTVNIFGAGLLVAIAYFLRSITCTTHCCIAHWHFSSYLN